MLGPFNPPISPRTLELLLCPFYRGAERIRHFSDVILLVGGRAGI